MKIFIKINFFYSFNKSLKNANLSWMYEIDLANNSREQNLEIIYNNKNVYYKTTRPVLRNEFLSAFPSKDLEISLGLQYIPTHPGKRIKVSHIFVTNYFALF